MVIIQVTLPIVWFTISVQLFATEMLNDCNIKKQ